MSTGLATQSPKELKIEAALDRAAAGGIELSAKNGMVITSMAQAMEFAKLMSMAREAVPKHLRENPGACLALSVQAYEWQINPFALANKSYVVNDRLCYEASLYQTVVTRRAPIVGRIKMEFAGDAAKRTCRVWAELSDGTGTVEYTSPQFGVINPKNSPLWKNDPDQQLFYFSVRSFARRHFPDVMMGIYTVDEMMDNTVETVRTVDARPKTERLAERLGATNTTQASDAAGDSSSANASKSEGESEPDPDLGSAYEGLLRRTELCVNQKDADQIKAEIAESLREGGLTPAGADDLTARLNGDE